MTNDEAGQVEEIGGQLDIRIHAVGSQPTPPADLILVDPQDRKAGKDPRVDRIFTDIPSSSYETESIDDDVTGAAGPETRIVYVGNTMSGEYTLRVVGTENASYDLELRGVDRELNPSAVRFLDIDIEAGSDHRYVIEYSSEPGSKIGARRD